MNRQQKEKQLSMIGEYLEEYLLIFLIIPCDFSG